MDPHSVILGPSIHRRRVCEGTIHTPREPSSCQMMDVFHQRLARERRWRDTPMPRKKSEPSTLSQKRLPRDGSAGPPALCVRAVRAGHAIHDIAEVPLLLRQHAATASGGQASCDSTSSARSSRLGPATAKTHTERARRSTGHLQVAGSFGFGLLTPSVDAWRTHWHGWCDLFVVDEVQTKDEMTVHDPSSRHAVFKSCVLNFVIFHIQRKEANVPSCNVAQRRLRLARPRHEAANSKQLVVTQNTPLSCSGPCSTSVINAEVFDVSTPCDAAPRHAAAADHPVRRSCAGAATLFLRRSATTNHQRSPRGLGSERTYTRAERR